MLMLSSDTNLNCVIELFDVVLNQSYSSKVVYEFHYLMEIDEAMNQLQWTVMQQEVDLRSALYLIQSFCFY